MNSSSSSSSSEEDEVKITLNYNNEQQQIDFDFDYKALTRKSYDAFKINKKEFRLSFYYYDTEGEKLSIAKDINETTFREIYEKSDKNLMIYIKAKTKKHKTDESNNLSKTISSSNFDESLNEGNSKNLEKMNQDKQMILKEQKEVKNENEELKNENEELKNKNEKIKVKNKKK